MLSSGKQSQTKVQKYHASFVEECMKDKKQSVLLFEKRQRMWKRKSLRSDLQEKAVTAVTQEMEAVNHIKDMRMAQNETQQLFTGMVINDNLVSFQFDCGATCNVIPVHMLNPDTD